MLHDEIAKALRELVASIYKDCHGAYGADYYEGQYEKDIQALAKLFDFSKHDVVVVREEVTPNKV